MVNVEGYAEILEAIDIQGSHSMLYAYVPKTDVPRDLAWDFLQGLAATDAARHAQYLTTFRRLGMQGHARGEVWHMLDDDRPIKGLAKDVRGDTFSLKHIGEFKNLGHKSRIYHLREDRLIILLTAYEGKNEDKLTADAVNPALHLRERFVRDKAALLMRRAGGRNK